MIDHETHERHEIKKDLSGLRLISEVYFGTTQARHREYMRSGGHPSIEKKLARICRCEEALRRSNLSLDFEEARLLRSRSLARNDVFLFRVIRVFRG